MLLFDDTHDTLLMQNTILYDLQRLGGGLEALCSSNGKCFALLARCAESHVHQPLPKLRLFDALMRPILSFLCGVWAIAIVGSKTTLADLEQIEVRFLRMLLGAPHQTSTKLNYAEWGGLPPSHFWFQQCLKYFNRIEPVSNARTCKLAFIADRQCGLGWVQAWYHG